MKATTVRCRLDSTLETVDKAEEAVRTIAVKFGVDRRSIDQIASAVREATANAVLHGNQCDANKRVTLLVEAAPETFTVSVRDEGPGLDPSTLPNPLAPENLMKPSGRGIFLIRAFMDEVRFRNMNPGTEITIIKRIGKAARGGEEASK